MDPADFEPPLAAIDRRVYRLVPSIFPPISIFDRVADPADLEAVFAIEAMTNDRLRDEVGDISLVPPDERVFGPGATPIMAAFTHLNPEGARFTDATFGAYYAGFDLATSVAETRYHRERFLMRTQEPPIDVDMRVYVARLSGELHDIRGLGAACPLLYHDGDYAAGQQLGRRLRNAGSNGLVYDSVRRAGGTCVAVYRPRRLADCRQERHLTYQWDGARIAHIYEKHEYKGG